MKNKLREKAFFILKEFYTNYEITNYSVGDKIDIVKTFLTEEDLVNISWIEGMYKSLIIKYDSRIRRLRITLKF